MHDGKVEALAQGAGERRFAATDIAQNYNPLHGDVLSRKKPAIVQVLDGQLKSDQKQTVVNHLIHSRSTSPSSGAHIDPHGQHQNAALDDHLPITVDVEHGHAVVQAGDDQCAEEGAVDSSGAAAHGGAADEAGGDGVEFAHAAGRGRAGGQACGVDHAGE